VASRARSAVSNTRTAPVNGWALVFAFANGQTVSTMRGGTPAQNGGTASVSPASYASTLWAGGSVTLGFTAAKGATNTAPAVSPSTAAPAPPPPVIFFAVLQEDRWPLGPA
jgi:hypothetical protein